MIFGSIPASARVRSVARACGRSSSRIATRASGSRPTGGDGADVGSAGGLTGTDDAARRSTRSPPAAQTRCCSAATPPGAKASAPGPSAAASSPAPRARGGPLRCMPPSAASGSDCADHFVVDEKATSRCGVTGSPAVR